MPTRKYGSVQLETSSEEKVLFPEGNLTKRDLIDYYEGIADCILPHLANRPLVLQRFPDGVTQEGFYQKQVPDYFPDWISTVRVAVMTQGRHQDLVVCQDVATLVYLANQATIALHPWLSRKDDLLRPDELVIDLDPPGDEFELARAAALRVRELFEELRLASYPKLTGARGLHVVVPLQREEEFDGVREFARTAMELLVTRHPNEFAMEQRKERRRGKLYLDVGRNAYAQTAIAPWSVRPVREARVAAPLFWRDLEHQGLRPRDFTIRNVARGLQRRDDPWSGMRRHAKSLRGPWERLKRLSRDVVRRKAS